MQCIYQYYFIKNKKKLLTDGMLQYFSVAGTAENIIEGLTLFWNLAVRYVLSEQL